MESESEEDKQWHKQESLSARAIVANKSFIHLLARYRALAYERYYPLESPLTTLLP